LKFIYLFYLFESKQTHKQKKGNKIKMQRAVTANDIVYLTSTLNETEGQQVRYYLERHMNPKDARFFEPYANRTVQQVLERACDRCVPVTLLASAISQGVGNKMLATRWLSSINVPSTVLESAEDFFNKPGVMAQIEPMLYDDGEFSRFCTAFEMPSTVILEFNQIDKRQGRGYLVLRRWSNMALRSVGDFLACLSRFAPALVEKLGFASTIKPSTTLLAPYQARPTASNNPLTDDGPKFIMPFSSSKVDEGLAKKSKIAMALKKTQSSQEITRRQFFEATDGVHANSCQELVTVLDKTGLWEMILANEGLLLDPEVAAEVVRWVEDEVSPTKAMIQDFLQDDEWGNLTMKSFIEDKLLIIPNPELKAVATNWLQKMEGKLKTAQKAGINRFEKAKDLNNFFMDLVGENNVFKAEAIPAIVSKLQDDDINTVELFSKLKPEELKEFGLTRGQIMLVQEALVSWKESTSKP
jgi:hypothetical protein